MNRFVRLMMLIAAVGQLLVAIGFFAHMPWTQVFWPFSYTHPLSFIFMSSIAAAAAASTLWALYTREDAAFAGIALDYIAIFGPLAVFSGQIYARLNNQAMLPLMIGGVIGVLFGLGVLWWSRQQPFHDTQPTPRPLRLTFGLFVVALCLVGGALVMKTKNIMPWSLSDEASVLYGWFFIGAAIYFIYGLLKPVWGNAGGQLAGFLAYDLVLIVPFLAHMAAVEPQHRLSLIIYIGVLVGSAALAVYYLLISPQTRLWRKAATLSSGATNEKGLA